MSFFPFICFLLFMSTAPCAASEIEIFINGVRYPSIEAYRASKEPKAQEKVVRIDPIKGETITEAAAKQWRLVGVEHAVGRVMVDFTQNWNDPLPKFKIEPRELEDRIKSLVDGRKAPVLIVSQDHKLRVMELKRE